MTTTEYRVIWRREGHRLGSRVFQRKGSARRLFELLTGDPHARCYHAGRGGDDPAYCFWADLDAGYRVHSEGAEPPPWDIAPRIEAREVGEWHCGAYGEDHSNGCPASAHYPLEVEP